MKGLIIRHGYRLGKIVDIKQNSIEVLYLGEEPIKILISKELFRNGEITRYKLNPGTYCNSPNGVCVVECIDEVNKQLYSYRVKYKNDICALVSEIDLYPIQYNTNNDPLSLLINLQPKGYPLFKTREELVETFHHLVREGSGFRSLLSSRIDLYPHQAYVAGVILMDICRRYIFADEVGLGKTIEAGIVIYDLLSQKPDAKVLIICPGALTQQWLCEIYSKFGGQVFKLLELHLKEPYPLKGANKVISSTNLAVYHFPNEIAQINWDMLVVDEVHHLLASPRLYEFVAKLCNVVPSVLLLSAIPAQKREDEFMRLLALLEPGRYCTEDPKQCEEFRELFALQSDISRRLRIMGRRVDSLESKDFPANEVIEVCRRLLEMPVLKEDNSLKEMIVALETDSSSLASPIKDILKYVVDRYRINKRILRNRRQHLLELGQIHAIERKCDGRPYPPDQLEIDSIVALENLLRNAIDSGINETILITLARTAFQSMSSPSSALDFLENLKKSCPMRFEEHIWDPIVAGELTGYIEWNEYRDRLCSNARRYISEDDINEAIRRTLAWNNFSGGSQRLIKLIEYLKLRSKESPLPKLIIFAGFPGIALPLAQELSLHLGKGSITEFRSELSREEKEENVSRFQNNHRTFVMVCDETGGEGRNFQFASEIVHFDMPWHVGRIEQRIGRIDRLGREKVRQDAVSIVFYNEHSVEAGLFHCYLSGFQVYNKSISGLEFALRDLEKEVVAMAIDKGRDGLMDFIPKLSSLTEQERDQDESQALSDLASFNRSAADRFQKVLQSEASELMLEEAFINYFRMITTHNSVKEINDSIFPQAIWQFSLDNTVYGALPLKDKNQEGLFGTCQGTFRREVARQRPQLNFFNVGNPVFDAVLSSLKLHSTGRVYALDCKSHEAIRWAGFEFVFGVSFDLEDIPNHWGMANQARSIFTVMPFHLFFKINGQYESSSDSLLKIRQSLRIADKGKTWGNLTKDKVAILPNLVEDANWQNVLLKTYEKAEYKAREHFNARLEREVREETKRLEEMLEKIRGQEGSFGKIEIQAIAGLLAAIPNWRVELDAIGFLGINLGLREG